MPIEAQEQLNDLFQKMALVSDETIEHMHESLRVLARGIKKEALERNLVPSNVM